MIIASRFRIASVLQAVTIAWSIVGQAAKAIFVVHIMTLVAVLCAGL